LAGDIGAVEEMVVVFVGMIAGRAIGAVVNVDSMLAVAKGE
jgi:hypothetical protein